MCPLLYDNNYSDNSEANQESQGNQEFNGVTHSSVSGYNVAKGRVNATNEGGVTEPWWPSGLVS